MTFNRSQIEVATMWSSQQYLNEGKKQGFDLAVLEAAARQIDQLVIDYQIPPILTLRHLAFRTKINYKFIRSVVENKPIEDKSFYRNFRIRKRSGGSRQINIPCPELMSIQRWIAYFVLRKVKVHNSSFAFSPNSSIVKCANRHSGAKWLIKMDVADFFGSITEIQVYRVFKSLGYQPLVALEIARLCTILPARSEKYDLSSWRVNKKYKSIKTYNKKLLGRLPQGAPTSPMLSNIVMQEVDDQLSLIARTKGLIYTRYSDDLTFSSKSTDFKRADAAQLIGQVSAILKKVGLYPNKSKSVIVPPGARKVVLGLLVDSDKPRLTKEFKDSLRQHFYYLEKYGPMEHAKNRNWETIGGLYRHLRGLIDFAKMVEEEYSNKLLAKLQSIFELQ